MPSTRVSSLFRLIFISLAFSYAFFTTSGQSKTDSLIALLPQLDDSAKVNVLNTLALQLSFRDATKSKEYAEQALAVSKQHNFVTGEARSLCILCSILGQEGQFGQALELCKNALALYEGLSDQGGMADVYNRTGTVYNLRGEYALALENFLAASKIRRALNQTTELASVIENIGIVYFRQGDYQAALAYFNESLEVYTQQNNLAAASKILVNLGATYNRLKMPKEALDANLKSLAYFEQVNNFTGIGIASNNVGNVYIELKQYQNAIDSYEKSLAAKEKMNDQRGMAVSFKNIAEAYLGLNDLVNARENIERSLRIAEQIGAKEQLKDAYGMLSMIYEKGNNFKAALTYEKKMGQAKDSLFSSEKTEQISRMRAIYETEKAEQEANLAKIQAQLDLNMKEVALRQRNFFIAAVIVLLVGVLLIIRLYRQVRNANQLLSDKNQIIERTLLERETLLREIHHRVKNNLQIISSLLSLQSKKTNNAQAQGAISESRNRVKSMSLIHEQLYEENTISGVEMKSYIERLVSSLQGAYGLDAERVEIKIDAPSLLLDVDSAIPLGLIINELVSNSMKYAFPENRGGNIAITLREKENELHLTIADTGVGMKQQPETESQSFGLSLVHSLMRKLKAEMNLISNQGTQIALIIRDFRKISTPVQT